MTLENIYNHERREPHEIFRPVFFVLFVPFVVDLFKSTGNLEDAAIKRRPPWYEPVTRGDNRSIINLAAAGSGID